MGNAAQGTPVGFARNLLADFPPYHPKALWLASASLRHF